MQSSGLCRSFRVMRLSKWSLNRAKPGIAELAALARKHNLPLLYDIGSGALLPGLSQSLKDEPSVKQALDDGADLVLFSADKILGGPQGGIAAGRTELVEKMRKHPLY